MKKFIYCALCILLTSSCSSQIQNTPDISNLNGSHLLTQYSEVSLTGKTATLYKSKNCGCCEGYAEALRKEGIEVTVIPDNPKLKEVRTENKIGEDFQSCHTTFIDGYFVEGHVPINVVKKLLSEKPQIDGIGLPGMPIGTPGMEGEKTQTYKIESIKNGVATSYLDL